MKKIVALMLTVVMAVGLLSGCGSKSSNTFTVGFDSEFPPYGYKEGTEYKGFDLDLAAEVCKRNGWEFVKQPINWDSKDMELDSGSIDCIWNGFTMSEDRLKKYTWTEPYLDNSQVFVVKKDSGIKTKADLKGKTVLVQADSSALEALQGKESKDLTDSFKNLDQVSEYNTAFLNLEAGSGDAIAMDVGVANYQIASRGSDKFEILSEQLSTEKYGVGFKLGNEELRDKVQKTLKEMVKDGTMKKIAQKYSKDNLEKRLCLKAD